MDTNSAEPIESTNEASTKAEEDEALDPRVQIELERLNHANEAINHLELQLDEARHTLKDFSQTLETELAKLEKKIGSAVAKAKSYYDVRIKLRDAKEALTKAKHRFERAQALHLAAKEIALVSADHIDEAARTQVKDTTWNETYRQAVAKAADAEREKYQADIDQQRAETIYYDLEQTVEKLQKDHRRSINKSQPYYQTKAEYHKELDFQKRKVYGLENCVNEAKAQYQQSLRNLELISNEIHEQRNQGKRPKELGERTPCIGEEQPTFVEEKPVPPPNPPSDNPSTDKDLRTSPEGSEDIDELNNQFILCYKRNSSVHDVLENRDRGMSLSSQVSQSTIDDDDRTGSLHILSDEQIEHLAYEFHPYSSEYSSQPDPLDELMLQIQSSKLQAKTFFRKLFKTNSINN